MNLPKRLRRRSLWTTSTIPYFYLETFFLWFVTIFIFLIINLFWIWKQKILKQKKLENKLFFYFAIGCGFIFYDGGDEEGGQEETLTNINWSENFFPSLFRLNLLFSNSANHSFLQSPALVQKASQATGRVKTSALVFRSAGSSHWANAKGSGWGSSR